MYLWYVESHKASVPLGLRVSPTCELTGEWERICKMPTRDGYTAANDDANKGAFLERKLIAKLDRLGCA